MFVDSALGFFPMEALADLLQGFSEPNRLAVLEALRSGPLNVTAVVEATGLSQALVSKHLKLLNIAGVVARRPAGSLVYYEVMDKKVFKIHGSSREVIDSHAPPTALRFWPRLFDIKRSVPETVRMASTKTNRDEPTAAGGS